MAESNNKFVIIIVGILSLMLLIPIIIESGITILAILFIILAIVGLKVISSSKTDERHNPMHRQPLDEESWSDAIKKLLFVLILSGVWGLMWMYFLW